MKASHLIPRLYSRRDFLSQVALAGGSVFTAMSALDLLAQDKGPTWIPRNAPRLSRAKKVAIIGAGAAGLCAAHELSKLGYEIRVFEGRSRPGGRIWTVRRNTAELDLNGFNQVCTFDEGQYLNAGPARLPQHHYTTFGYCKEFGVPLEVFTNYNEAAYAFQGATGLKRRFREVRADYEGYLSEMVAKALSVEQLDAPLTAEDREKLFEYLRVNASLDKDLRYGPNSSRGYTEWPAAPGQPGVFTTPDDVKTMIGSGFPRFFANQHNINQEAAMFQPVGGMDAIPNAMARVLAGVITYEAEVTAVRKTTDGRARVEFKRDGETSAYEANFCVCTLPATILKKLTGDLSPAVREVAGGLTYGTSSKIGLQFKRRFWEEDDWIYGGPSYTDLAVRQIWYPSYGYLGKKGLIVGYYVGDGTSGPGTPETNLSRMTPAQRLEFALNEGEKIHPGNYRAEFDTSFSVSWQVTRFNEGALVNFRTPEDRTAALKILGEADGPLYYAGEHVSWISGWIAGAFESALRVVKMIHTRALA
jgi:monoamine oxidase